MLALIRSYGLKGLDGFPVQAEIDMHMGMPTYDIVGLADTFGYQKQRLFLSRGFHGS